MASNMEGSLYRGSDSFFDFSCFTCQENDKNTHAAYYCEDCSKFYCCKCVEYHNFLYKKHAMLDKQNISKWPETNVGGLEQCKEHMKEKLTFFCEDHSQLICHVCHFHNHLKCGNVILIADKVEDLNQKGDFKQLSDTFDTQQQRLIQKIYEFKKKLKSLEKSYKKNLEKINAFRKLINDALEQLENTTKYALDKLRAKMWTSIQTDIENCTELMKNITHLKEHFFGREDKSEAVSFIKYRKCRDQSLKIEAFLQDMGTKNKMTFTFKREATIQQTLSTLSGLGQILSKVQHQPSLTCDPNQVIRIRSSKTYRVKAKNDSNQCVISGICETTNRELLITDFMHNNVTLLDQTYKVVSTCDLPDGPRSMCSIDSSLVAVTLYNKEVHFIKVTNGLLIKDKILKLEHNCLCITHHHGNLYITDGRALYRSTVDGSPSIKMYEHTSGGVTTCAVSPNKDRIYVAKNKPTELVTLSSDGKVISTFVCPRMEWEETLLYLPGLHVTDSGQVLVCGMESNRILQVDKDGRQRLAEVVTVSDGVNYPISVYYSKLKGKLIVGMKNNNYIKVFKLQPLSEKDIVVSGHVFLNTI